MDFKFLSSDPNEISFSVADSPTSPVMSPSTSPSSIPSTSTTSPLTSNQDELSDLPDLIDTESMEQKHLTTSTSQKVEVPEIIKEGKQEVEATIISSESSNPIIDEKRREKSSYYRLLLSNLRYESKHSEAVKLAREYLNEFRELDDYSWVSLLFDLSVSLYYVGNIEWSSKINTYILLTTNNSSFRSQAQGNLIFAGSRLEFDREEELKFDPPYLLNPSGEFVNGKMRVMNPSIATDNYRKCYWVILRTSNFTQEKGSNYRSMDQDGMIRTRNFLGKVNINFELEQTWEIIDTSTQVQYSCTINGIEDARIFLDENGQLFMTGTTFYNHSCGHPKISIGQLEFPDPSDKIVRLILLIPLLFPPSGIQKNWLPISSSEMIVHSAPLEIYTFKWEDPNSTWEQEISPTSPIDIGGRDYLRGSGKPVRYQNGMLWLTHEVHYSNGRTYYHRLIWRSRGTSEVRVSPIFWFSSNFSEIRIEFGIGLDWDLKEENLILGAGINDRQAKFYFFPRKKLDNFLYPILFKSDLHSMLQKIL